MTTLAQWRQRTTSPGPDIDAEFADHALRSTARARLGRGRHLRAEDGPEGACDRVPVERVHEASPPMETNRSGRIRSGWWPRATRVLTAVSTEAVGPHA